MLELRLLQASLLKNVVEALSASDLFSDAHFGFSATGLEVQAMDTSTVALVALHLSAKAFDNYSCDRDHSMGLNLADMGKAFRYANNDDTLTIKSEDGFPDTDSVIIKFEPPDEDGETLFFDFDSVGIDDMPVEIPEFPESEFQAIVRMPSARFTRICKMLSSFGDRDTVSISVDKEWGSHKECVDFYARGKTGSATIFCRQTQTTLIEVKEKVSEDFDLRYMNHLSKVSTLSDHVTIRLSSPSKLPVMFEYKITEMGYIRYYIAPYIYEMRCRTDDD